MKSNTDSLVKRIYDCANKYILRQCNEYDVNVGGSGMLAVLLCKRIETYYLHPRIKAYFVGNQGCDDFYNAEHYSVIIGSVEINPYRNNNVCVKILEFKDVDAERLYWSVSGQNYGRKVVDETLSWWSRHYDDYDHKHDTTIQQMINKYI